MTAGTMTDLTARAAERFGGRLAVTMLGSHDVSFRDMDDMVARFAGGLKRMGLVAGDRILLYLPNGIEWIIAYHAIARIGAVVVPANILLSIPELAFIAADSGARLIVCGAGHPAQLRSVISTAAELLIVVAGDEWAELHFVDLLAGAPVMPVDVAPQDLFTIAYTAGTTGKPKGAMLSHRAVFGSTSMTATIHVRHEGDRVLSALPFPHVYGNVVMNGCFIAGYHLLVMERFDPQRALALIESEQVTLFEGVPTMYYQMLSQGSVDTTDFTALQRCTVGGQTMPTASIVEVARRFGCPLLELWGMTEVAGPATSHSPYWPSRHGSIGLPFPGMEVRIADLNDASIDARIGEAGELCVRGPLVMQGYWNNPAATSAAMDSANWFVTGDVTVQQPDGYLTIVDRRKDVIITAGYNIYPAELEQAIASHPAVAMVAVASIPDLEKGELAHAFVVLRPNTDCTAEELLTHCRQTLAVYKVPKAIAFVDDLPKTSTGKIMRRALSEDARCRVKLGKDPP